MLNIFSIYGNDYTQPHKIGKTDQTTKFDR